jgi:NitT/TauT family transport system substrate-binding protein
MTQPTRYPFSTNSGNHAQSQGSPAADYQTVVSRAAEGNREAFEILFRCFQQMVLAEARKWLDDCGSAEDAVQDAFFTVFLKLSDLRDPQAFPSWLKKIVRNCCLKINKEQRRISLDILKEIEFLRNPSLGPLGQTERHQSRAIVAKTLNELDGVAREACIQRYILGWSYKAIAASLKVPLGTVKRRLFDAKSQLITMLKAKGEPVICVGYLPITDHLLAMVSHYLNQSHLGIGLKRFLSWASLEKSLVNGMLDAAFVMAPMAMSLRNKGVPLVYVMDAHREGSAITVRNGLDVRHKWDGIRVGLPYATSTHSMLLSSMFDTGIGSETTAIQAQYQGPSYLLNSLGSSEIDAFFCAEPWNTKAVIEKRGSILVRSKDLFPGHICCILVVMEDFLLKHGDLVQSYLRLLTSANRYLSKNPGHSAKIQELYTGVPAGINEKVLRDGDTSFCDLIPDRGRIEEMMTLALTTGVLDSPCELDAFLCTDMY